MMMNCKHHPERRAVFQCAGCGAELCDECAVPSADGVRLCHQCAALAAAQDVVTEVHDRRDNRLLSEQRLAERKAKKKKIRRAVYLLVLLAAGIVLFLQVPKIIAGHKSRKPLRQGTYQTDAAADACIHNLWRASKMLQEGRSAFDGLVCPAGKAPYRVSATKDDVVVSCPEPGRHGLKTLEVSRRQPCPEVQK